MQEHQVRRVPIVDAEDCVIGIVSQADLALKGQAGASIEEVAEISKAADCSLITAAERRIEPPPPISSIS